MKDEKILKKLDKLLKLYGVDDESKRTAFLNDVQDAKYDEEEIIEETDEETADNLPDEEMVNEVEAPKEEDGEEVETNEPETDDVGVETDPMEEVSEEPKEEMPMEEPQAETDPNEVNPAEIQPEVGVNEVVEDTQVEPQVDPLEELKGKYSELEKANEGLLARIGALEEALKMGGILNEPMEAVGLDNPRTPANNPYDDPMEEVLNSINRHSY